MRLRRAIGLAATMILAAALARAADEKGGAPYMKSVEPSTAKAGDVVRVAGDFLDKSRVAEVYLSRGSSDLKVEIVEQTADFIRFKVPAGVTPGRYGLTFLTAGPDPKLLEQPVYLLIE
jgi:hypothetical protein